MRGITSSTTGIKRRSQIRSISCNHFTNAMIRTLKQKRVVRLIWKSRLSNWISRKIRWSSHLKCRADPKAKLVLTSKALVKLLRCDRDVRVRSLPLLTMSLRCLYHRAEASQTGKWGLRLETLAKPQMLTRANLPQTKVLFLKFTLKRLLQRMIKTFHCQTLQLRKVS